MSYFVYGHFKNERCYYVGCGSEDRPYDFYRRNENWKKLFSKENPPIVIIFHEVENVDEALKLEQEQINRFKEKGYNLANKEPGRYWSGKKRDPDLMKRLVELSHTPEAIEKRRKKMIGRNISEEHKQKIGEASKAHWQTINREEMGAKISAAKKGRPNGRLGCTFTDEHKRKISEATKGRVYGKEIIDKIKATKLARGNTTKKARAVLCVENGVQYRCAKDAALALNLSDKHIQACCVGRRNKHGGFTFKYAESIQIQSS